MSKNRAFEKLMTGLDEIENHLTMKCPRCNLPWGVHSANLGAPGGYECPVLVPAAEEVPKHESNYLCSQCRNLIFKCTCPPTAAEIAFTSTPLPVDLEEKKKLKEILSKFTWPGYKREEFVKASFAELEDALLRAVREQRAEGLAASIRVITEVIKANTGPPEEEWLDSPQGVLGEAIRALKEKG